MLVKLCGFIDADSVRLAVSQKCNFLGFVFYEKSPRFVSVEKAAIISASIPPTIAKVAVAVNPDFEFLSEIIAKFCPDFFQFHGSETPEFLFRFRQKFPSVKIIKAFRIADSQDLLQIKNFENCSDFFLLDSKVKNEVGGSGEKFNWQILKDFQSPKSWFLAGGLNSKNLAEAIKITGAQMIDVSSGVEKFRGKKSNELIAEFMSLVRTKFQSCS